ncbi:hypothetical protein HOP50_20g85930 [Chloropicon primus]|nr:hypothetical protein A3770_20p85600 [Chloropicon primus]UPR05243.1 hypothetical protein HOP50_20g85930 [Chloropicon primus]|eukprot:QDZ26042.1 hypothetical protein A3770_20p85600 [Chloropicon primus]
MKSGGDGNVKRGFSSRLSSMKFMQRGRGSDKSKKDASDVKRGKECSSTVMDKGKEKEKLRVVVESDPLPRGRTTGRLSFGSKKKTKEMDDGSPDANVKEPLGAEVKNPTYDEGEQDRSKGKRKAERSFMKPAGAGDVKKFTKRSKKV